MLKAYVGIGSNLEPEQNIRSAVRALRARYGALTISPVYQSTADGFAGPDFYNLVVGFDTHVSAADIAATLNAIEHDHGRVRYGNGMHSRTLDLDLLLYGNEVRRDPGLTLPRADITRFAFVLKPLADIAPDLRHPELGTTMEELWRDFAGKRVTLKPVALLPPL